MTTTRPITTIKATNCFGRTREIKIGETYQHDRCGKVKVLEFDEKHDQPICILDCGEWCYAEELV